MFACSRRTGRRTGRRAGRSCQPPETGVLRGGGGKHFRPYRTPAVFFRGRNFFISFFLPNFGEHPTRNEMETLRKVIRFYVEGFREMTVGRTLWAIILIKLFILFAVLKVFFFPDLLAGKSPSEKAGCVLENLTPEIPQP